MTYSLNDYCIVPKCITTIEHRSECNPYNIDGMLPLFTAPMNSIVNENNYQLFIDNKVNVIIPRGVDYNIRFDLSDKTFVAVGLCEFEQFLEDLSKTDYIKTVHYVCIDIANGHMKKLIDLCAKAKNQFGGSLLIMAGNIANPETYLKYAIAGIDFVRIGIGGGSVCTTSANGGVHYGMASLIRETVEYKKQVEHEIKQYRLDKDCLFSNSLFCNTSYKSIPLIVADGGFDNYDKIIKALAFGADFVMVGKLFAQTKEACGEVVYKEVTEISPEVVQINNLKSIKTYVYKVVQKPYRLYYGMSTKRAQVETGSEKLKTSEGIETMVPISYSISGWCENFKDYLRSMMSYTDSRSLLEFQNAPFEQMNSSEYILYNK